MAQFASEIVQVNSSVGTLSSQVWSPSNASITTLGALGSVPSTANLQGLIVANTGANTIYLNSGSVNSLTNPGLPVAANSEMYLSGYAGIGAAAGTIWAVTGASGQTSSTQAGLPSVASVI